MMKKLMLAVALMMVPLAAMAQNSGTKEDAQAMVNKALDMMYQKGVSDTFALINNREAPVFHDRDLYVFAMSMDEKATLLAHGIKPQMIGKDFSNFKDRFGAYCFREMVMKAEKEGEGWIHYDWPNPITQRMSSKTSYVKAFEDEMLIGVGVYE